MKYSIRGEVLEAAGKDPSILGVSLSVVCPACGITWARLQIAGRDWRGWTVACPDCPPWPFDDSVPGSLLAAVGVDLLPHLPPEVLRHEFEVHMKFYEKGMVCSSPS